MRTVHMFSEGDPVTTRTVCLFSKGDHENSMSMIFCYMATAACKTGPSLGIDCSVSPECDGNKCLKGVYRLIPA